MSLVYHMSLMETMHLTFDGSNDKVTYSNSSTIVGTDDFTISFWFKTDNTTSDNSYNAILSQDGDTDMWMFGIEYGGMEFQTVGTLRFVLNEGE